MACTPACNEAAVLDLGSQWTDTDLKAWRTLKVRLGCFRDAAVTMSAVSVPFAIRTTGRLGLTLRTVRLVSDPAGAVCLPHAAGHA
jgi:beta-glucosidase